MATQTLFEKWCEDEGFDPKGVFTVVHSIIFTKGTKVTRMYDDNTGCIKFKDIETAQKGYICFIGDITQLPEDNTMNNPVNATAVNTTTQPFPQTPFKLSCGDRPDVRKWLKDNGCKWASGSDLTKESTNTRFLFVVNNTVKLNFTEYYS